MKSSPARRAGTLMACTVIAFATLAHVAYAAGGHDSRADTVHNGMSILFIGTISADCYPDTVWGDRQGPIDAPSYLPKVIVWGQYDKSGLRGRKDTAAKCKGHIPDRFKVPYTLITYPAWRDLRGTFTPLKFNPEDTLSDLLFALRGNVGEGINQHDTLRLLAVFAQSGIDTISTIDLASISVVQVHPFVAMELRKGSDVVSEKQRDFSGRKSYEVRRVGFREHEENTTEPHSSPAAGVLHVYPNPTGIAAQIEGASIPVGEYSVEVVAVNGEVARQQDVIVKEGGSLLQTLDVSDLPTGYYIIRVQQHGRPLGTYPIVVAH